MDGALYFTEKRRSEEQGPRSGCDREGALAADNEYGFACKAVRRPKRRSEEQGPRSGCDREGALAADNEYGFACKAVRRPKRRSEEQEPAQRVRPRRRFGGRQ
jgi:hypothetical protein